MELCSQTAKNVTLVSAGERLKSAQNIAVISHCRPDGDAIGSTLALSSVLNSLGKLVISLNQDVTPEYLRFLESDEIALSTCGQVEMAASEIELIVALDCATVERLGKDLLEFLPNASMITIDHHISNECYGDDLILDVDAAATGEILFDLFEANEMPLTDQARDALYVAISTDTGSLQYSNATAKTYHIMSQLVSMGVDVASINAKTYFSHSVRRLEILRAALQTFELCFNGEVSYWKVSFADKKQVGVQAGDMEGLMDLLRGIAGVRVCFTLEESSSGGIRLSMRSKDESIDVSKVCATFGGGGHRMAAGATLDEIFSKSHERVLEEIQKVL